MTQAELASINIPVGWLCPLCGTIYSPGTSSCSKCVVTEDAPKVEVLEDTKFEDFPQNPSYDA